MSCLALPWCQTLAAAYSKGRSKREEQAKAAEGRWQVLVQESQHSLLEDTFINTCVTDVSGEVWRVGWVEKCGGGRNACVGVAAFTAGGHLHQCLCDGCKWGSGEIVGWGKRWCRSRTLQCTRSSTPVCRM